eukprot:15469421-Alexandrium_andersonii.AAC.1
MTLARHVVAQRPCVGARASGNRKKNGGRGPSSTAKSSGGARGAGLRVNGRKGEDAEAYRNASQ